MKFVSDYAKSQIDDLYLIRYRILNPYFNTNQSHNGINMNCWTNIKGILDKIIENVIPSFTIWCNCCPQNQQKFPVLELNYQELTLHGLSELEKSISHPRRTCVQCESNIKNIKFENIFFFDVQPIEIEKENMNFTEKEIFVHKIVNSDHGK